MAWCVFCGANNPATYKLLPQRFVVRLLQKQRDAGLEEPVLSLMWNLLASLPPDECADEAEEAGEPGAPEEPEEPGEPSEGGDDVADGDHGLTSCMCCFYWVSRRDGAQIAALPMQNLLWFVRHLEWCEGSKCDSRILQRLVQTVAEKNNVFASLFDSRELARLREIALLLRAARKTPARRGLGLFCIKNQLAALWREQNAHCLCLPHATAADLLRH